MAEDTISKIREITDYLKTLPGKFESLSTQLESVKTQVVQLEADVTQKEALLAELSSVTENLRAERARIDEALGEAITAKSEADEADGEEATEGVSEDAPQPTGDSAETEAPSEENTTQA